VRWGEPRDTTSNTGFWLIGFLPDAMVRFMTRERTMDVDLHRLGVRPERFGVAPERARDHMDCAVVRALQRAGLVLASALYATPGSPRAQIILSSLVGVQVLHRDQ
jgi:hypothetical protein